MKTKEKLIAGLDIGTTKICAIIGQIVNGGIDIIGIGIHPSRGLRKGVVINIEKTVESIKRAVEEAELMAGCEIKSVYTGIAGGHIKGFNSHGVIAIKSREVTEHDVRRVVDAAGAVAIPLDREVIHIIPQEFIIDEQDGIKDPVGMSGVRMEVKVHIVTGAVTSAQNIVRSCQKSGLAVRDIVLQQLASADAVLNADEKEIGVCLVDIGGGTTDIAVFANGSLKHTAVVTIGGDYITSDISICLRTPSAEAEKIKKKHGVAMVSLVDPEETIEIASVGGRRPRIVPKRLLAEIVEPRAEEILALVYHELKKSGCIEAIPAGLVLTGGTVIMPGFAELAEKVFDLPVRRGYPQGIGGLVEVVNSPLFATGVGLVLHAFKQEREAGSNGNGSERVIPSNGKLFRAVLQRMKSWFVEVF